MLEKNTIYGSRVTAKTAGMESMAKIKSETSISIITMNNGVIYIRASFLIKNRLPTYLGKAFDRFDRNFTIGQSGYNLSEINRIVDTSKTKTVILNRKPEVYLIYLTTWVNDSGQLDFRKDIYNRDERVYNALQDKPVYDLQ